MTPLARLADVLIRLRLGEPAFAAYERWRAFRTRDGECADGLPLPPAYLRVLTAGGGADAESFLELGRATAEEFLRLAADCGAAPGAADAVLEFGCGCGRVARHMPTRTPARLHGCDIRPKLVAWCARNLPGDYRLTRLEPPLPYDTGAFALVYAVSVFTHMHAPHARRWLQELARVTRPGGLAILTFNDEHTPAAARLQPKLSADGFAVLYEGREGTGLLTTYFTHEGFAARAAPDWRPVRTLTSPESATRQAVAVFRRVSAEAGTDDA